jgi:hypothetical protein
VEPTSTFTVAQTISSGKLPHNDQVLASLKEIEDPLMRQAHEKGGVEGRLAQQTQQLVQHTRELLAEKNSDDTLLKISTHAQETGIAFAGAAKDQQVKTDEKVLEVHQLLIAFRNTATALAKNHNFWSHLIELIQILENLLFDITHTTLDKKLTKIKNKPIEITAKDGSKKLAECQPHAQPFVQTEEAMHSAMEQKEKTEEIPKMERSRTHDLIQSQQSGGQVTEKRKMTDEERKYSYEKLRIVMLELGQTSEYKLLVERLTSFIENNGHQIAQFAGQGKDKSKTAISALADDIQELFEKCSGNVSLTSLREKINQAIQHIENDPEVRNFFVRVRELFRGTVTRPEEQDPEKIDNEIQSLSKKAHELLKKPDYHQDMNIILTESKGFLGRIREDEQIKRLETDVQNLRKEIMCNEKGQIDFGTIRNSLPALKNVLVPALTQALKTIPVTPIHSDDEKYTIDVSNLALSANELLPDNANIHFTNDLFFDFSGHANDRFDSALTILLNDFTTTLKDLNFHYERKKIPRMSDAGVADISIVGTNIKIKWRMEKIDDHLSFNVDKVKCTMRELNTNVKEAQHKILDRLALKLFNNQIKKSIEIAVEKALRDRLEKFTINTTTSEISSNFKSAMGTLGKKSSKEEIKKKLESAVPSSTEESEKKKIGTTPATTVPSSTEEPMKMSSEESKHHHHHHHHHAKESKKTSPRSSTEETPTKPSSPTSSTDAKKISDEPMKKPSSPKTSHVQEKKTESTSTDEAMKKKKVPSPRSSSAASKTPVQG